MSKLMRLTGTVLVSLFCYGVEVYRKLIQKTVSLSLGNHRELQGNRRTLRGGAGYLDGCVVLGGNQMSDGKAQAGAAGGFGSGGVNSVKAVKDFGLLFFRDTYACIGDGNFEMAVGFSRGKRN